MKYRYCSIVSRRLCKNIVCRKRVEWGRCSVKSALVAENKKLQCQVEEMKLDLAASSTKISYFGREYDSICNSRSWLYTAPIRDLLDAIILFRRQAGHCTAALQRMFKAAGRILGRPCRDWVAIANGCRCKIAIVLSADGGSGDCDVSGALANNGYLVFLISRKLPTLSHPGIIPVSHTDFQAGVARLRSGPSGFHLCIITAPCQSTVKTLPQLRSVGYAIIVDIMKAWEAAGAGGYPDWYEKCSEEQAILCADLVVVASSGLADKYAYLRRDVVCIDNQGVADSDEVTVAENRYSQLLMRAAHKTNMSALYA